MGDVPASSSCPVLWASSGNPIGAESGAGVEPVQRYTARWVAWSVGVVSIALLVAALILFLIDRSRVPLPESIGVWSLLTGFEIAVNVPVPVLGALIASRQPRNPIGWIYLVATFLFALAAFGQLYAVHVLLVDPGILPGGRFLAWLSAALLPIALCMLPFLFLLFPTGHLPSTKWRPVAWLAGLGLLCLTAGSITLASRIWSDPFAGSEDAMRGLSGFVLLVLVVGEIALPVTLVLSAVSVVGRFRRARGDERQQVKWFVAAAALVAVSITLGLFSETIAASVAASLSIAFMDVAIAIAVLKYRLYDIDLIIGKTIVYGLLAAFITAVYVLVVVLIGAVIGVTEGLSLIATAIVAVAFQPLRGHAQHFANRLVYGERATPYEVLSKFSEQVGETYSGEDIHARMVRLLAEGTGATSAGVWLMVDEEFRPVATWPTNGTPPAVPAGAGRNPSFGEATTAVPVKHRGELLGMLTVVKPPNEPLTPVEQTLVNDLAGQAALLLVNSVLIEDLRASRQRLVTAQDEERRRLERNLHDGAQQQLVALSVKQRLAEGLVRKDPNKAAEMLADLQADTAEALENLRDLARGIYPPLLADQGLPAALEAQARKASVPITIDSNGVGRYPQEVEAAVYFCCLEALQNVVKYAEATKANVSLSSQPGQLSFSVTDDGKGFDPATRTGGSGLQGMADRVAALGGSLNVRSEPGTGTTVTGQVPAQALEDLAVEKVRGISMERRQLLRPSANPEADSPSP
jgi:signal transduction histidine kinase